MRALANVENFNKIANILNDITGEGCYIDKPLNGDPWTINISDDTSGEVPLVRRKVLECEVSAKNKAVYHEYSNSIMPNNVAISVNGVAVVSSSELPISWASSAGLKYLFILQHYNYRLDADSQLIGNPDYVYAADTTGMGGSNYALIAKIPYCRLEIPVVGEPPHIQCLLEGPLRLYCYRGDNQARSFATGMPSAMKGLLKPKSITTESTDSLPVKVRNINAAADGYYNAYPHGRYHIVTSQGVDTVEWYEPEEPEQTKNDSKLLLLRYLYPQNNVPHGLPYWRTINQFLDNAQTWIYDYIVDVIEEDKSWLISVFTPWAWEVWSQYPGPYQPVLEADAIEGLEIVAAVMDRQGHWHSVFDIVVSGEEYEVALDDYDDLRDRVDDVEAVAQGGVDSGDAAEDIADDAQQTIANFTDYTANANLVDYEAGNTIAHVNALGLDFADLDTRITALEQRNA